MKNARELRNLRAGKKVEAQTILDAATKENRELTNEERTKYDALLAEIDSLQEEIRIAEADAQRTQRMQALQAEGQPAPMNPLATARIGMNDREIERYSLVRAIRAAASNNWSQAGLEREASEAVAKRFGRDPRSFFIPHDVVIGGEHRDLTVGTPDAGGYLVQTQYPLPMIEMLRKRLILAQAGIRILTGLVGDMAIPKHSAAGTGYWLAESNAPTESQQTIGQAELKPHTFGAYSDISHKLLVQSSIDVENFVRDDLARVIALGVDYAGLHGDDSADVNQPDGIAATSGIGSVVGGTNGAAPDWADIVDLEKEVAVDDAEVDTMAYITNAAVRGKFKKTFRNATYGEIPVWEGSELNGHRALVSNQVKSNLTKGTASEVCSAIFYGNWDDEVMGLWGDGIDILVDPFSLSTQRALRVVAFQDVDFAVRHAESFAAMLDALTS